MAGCSVGNPADVLLKGELFAANVLAILAASKVGVKHEVDDKNVGVFSTTKEHGFTVSPEEKQQKRKKRNPVRVTKKACSEDGCPNKAHARGLCNDHSGMLCSVEGCAATTLARGLCKKHGAFGECKASDCTTAAQKRSGYCAKHRGVHGFCDSVGCTTAAIAGGFACAKHGGNAICTADGCIRNARPRKKVCFVHSADRKPCSAEGCGNIAKARGLCEKHDGGKKKKVCSTEGCDTAVYARGVCCKHGAMGFCSVANCTSVVRTRGRCVLHGGGSKKVCKVNGCTSLVHKRSLCVVHGAKAVVLSEHLK